MEIRDIISHIVEKESRKEKNTKFKNMVNSTKTENAFIMIKRKFVNVQMDDTNLKFQLDTDFDLMIVN